MRETKAKFLTKNIDNIEKLAALEGIKKIQLDKYLKGLYGRDRYLCCVKVPDYFNDLNATHNLKKLLSYEQLVDYNSYIREILDKEYLNNEEAARAGTIRWDQVSVCYSVVTAEQECEAILKVLGN